MTEVKCLGEPLSQPIYWKGKQWAVTDFGIEALDGKYVIQKPRLWEDMDKWGWEKQMSEKEWVDMADFKEALSIARNKFKNLAPKTRTKA